MNIFALSIGLGAALGLWQVARTAPSQKALINVRMGLVVLFGGWLGARLVFILTHSTYYANHLNESVQLWLGGLSWTGAVIGIFSTAAMIAVVKKISVGKLLDDLFPIFPPLAIAIWLGCWQSGCAYGPIVPETAVWGLASQDETGVILRRFPTQLLASLTLLVYFLWLESRLKKFAFPGRKICLSGLGISVIVGFFSFLRADPAQFWLGLRLESWACVGFSLLFLIALILNIQKQKRTDNLLAMPFEGNKG